MPPVESTWVRAGGQVPVPRLPQRGCRAAALGMDEQLRLRVGGRLAAQFGRADPGVHVALAHPDVHVRAAGHPLHVGAEELVGQEQDLPFRREGRYDLRRVGRRAAQVGFRLDLGAGVHVRDDRGARMLGLPVPDLLRGDGVGERAAGPRLRDQHGPVRGEDLGRLRHEVDPGEHDDARPCSPRPAGTARASHRRDRRRPGSRVPGSCARGSRRRARPPAAGSPRPTPRRPVPRPGSGRPTRWAGASRSAARSLVACSAARSLVACCATRTLVARSAAAWVLLMICPSRHRGFRSAV